MLVKITMEWIILNIPFLRRSFEWDNEGENMGAMNRLLIILKKREKIRKLRRGGCQRQRKDLVIKMVVVKRIGLKYPDTVADYQCAINISQHRQWRFV